MSTIYYITAYAGDDYITDTVFYATRELAQAALDRQEAERRAEYEAREARQVDEYKRRAKAKEAILDAGLELPNWSAWDLPTQRCKYKSYLMVAEVELVTE